MKNMKMDDIVSNLEVPEVTVISMCFYIFIGFEFLS